MDTSLPGDDRAAFSEALARLSAARKGDDLCGPFVGAAQVSGASISTLGRPLGSETVCASNRTAARIDEIQIDLGEGPCWDALSDRRPVLETDLARTTSTNWPSAREAFRLLDVGAIYSFPLYVGELSVGAVDLYNDRPRDLTARAVADVTTLAEIASRRILQRALDDVEHTEDGLPDGPHSRREMHQASGMVAAQLGIGVEDALLVLRGRAYSTSRTVAQVAEEVVARRLRFDL
ncbi:transcriptional regulator [Microbacterium sp. Gd 4-13]|uniref:GAF and ANTAR domain-containing protein n=1 Tax=Microbacterium sp. Gd 4-13 TaxID=2173179 RepID=UPI000D57EC77|nr:GAF and ANTAR domain-containing protein [Microbacterium sp. Gd 4-13]PVW06516.1 transcriptional regulator [Microbacterium sp. Gd 4-13]